ncbi:MAG: dethiobiotin synthase [Actinomycetota bacterium]|nr:dethiobiotin synthase [Actinomycetota bacterium]
MRGCLVTGTDTGVGKTVLSAAIAAALVSRRVAVRALKPIITGLDDPSPGDWPRDHELLAAVSGRDADEVVLSRYGPAVSPHLAAQLANRPIVLAQVLAGIAAAATPGTTLIVEGVGGLLVPLGEGIDVRDLARGTGLPLIVAARPGLGTINHTLLTLESARAAGLEVRSVVLTPWPERPDAIELSNRETIERLGAIEVGTLGWVSSPTAAALGAAAGSLPLARWLA